MNLPPECGVVFDCNVLLQAAARKAGPAAACLRLAEKGFVRLYLSEEILTEISEVLSRPQVRAQFPELTNDIVEAFIERLKNTAHTVGRVVPRKFTYQRDVDDECYVNNLALLRFPEVRVAPRKKRFVLLEDLNCSKS